MGPNDQIIDVSEDQMLHDRPLGRFLKHLGYHDEIAPYILKKSHLQKIIAKVNKSGTILVLI